MKLKMKFYGRGVVWDKENDKQLCEFVNGEFETDNERTATILHTLGYRSESDGWKTFEGDEERQEVKAEQIEAEADEADYEEMTFAELKEAAKAKGFTVGHKSKADLIDMLREGE